MNSISGLKIKSNKKKVTFELFHSSLIITVFFFSSSNFKSLNDILKNHPFYLNGSVLCTYSNQNTF